MPQTPSSTENARAQLGITPIKMHERVTLKAAAPLLLITVESAVAHASCRGQGFILDRSGLLVVPRGSRVLLTTPAAASRIAALSVLKPLLGAVDSAYGKCGADLGSLTRIFDRLELLPRTVWVHELFHRYIFERYTLGQAENQATAFLETEIVKEARFLFRDRDAGTDRTSLVYKQSPCLRKAVTYIEANPFRACRVAELAEKAGASESTLLRAFRRELGCSPATYWRSRKLDEALVLLRAGNRSVGEVAAHVGYENATAFAFAFRSRFGQPPSAFLLRRPVRPASASA